MGEIRRVKKGLNHLYTYEGTELPEIENSCIVYDIDKKKALDIAQKLNQETII